VGVHELSQYPQIRELLEIPPGEPLFIIRAQDVLSPGAVAAYRCLYQIGASIETHKLDKDVSKHFSDHLYAVETEFMRWQIRYKERVKFPD